MLKAVAIEHHNDADSAVVAVLDEVMPSSVGISSADHDSIVFNDDLVRNFSANGARETGSSSSAGKCKYRDCLVTVCRSLLQYRTIKIFIPWW
jgi:hypothetical protein